MATIALSPGAKFPLLKPVTVLAGWTFVMQAWMHKTRISAIGDYNVRMDPEHFDHDRNTKIPIAIRQIGDNYNHLHEQPTVFYAVSLALSLIGDNHPYTQYGAWGYVGIRILHSLYQSLNNTILNRFQIFATSSAVLAGLTGRLAQLVF